MSAPALLLRAWRARTIRWAMALLDYRLNVYEAAYGKPPSTPAGSPGRTARTGEIEISP